MIIAEIARDWRSDRKGLWVCWGILKGECYMNKYIQLNGIAEVQESLGNADKSV